MSPLVSWLLVLGVLVGAVLIAAGVVALDGRKYDEGDDLMAVADSVQDGQR